MANRFADPTEEQIVPTAPATGKKNRFAETKQEDAKPQSAWQEYQDMPWYQQLTTAIDDMAMLGASGLTFGAGEGLAKAVGNEPFLQEMEDRRQRSGVPGISAEILGSAVSPLTRLVMAGGKAIIPSQKFLPSLARGAGEGATLGASGSILSGNPEDILTDSTVGAVLGPAIPLAAKGVGAAGRGVLSWLTGLYPDVFETAYKAGRDVGPIRDAVTTGFKGPMSYAFKQGRGKGGQPVPMEQAEDMRIKTLDEISQTPIDKQWALERLQPIFDKTKTSSGMSRLNKAEFNQTEQMKRYINDFYSRGGSIEDADALINKLAMFRSSKSEAVKKLADRATHVLTNATARAKPKYTEAIEKYRDAKEAYAAGRASKRVMPHGIPSMLASGAGALSFLHNPLLGIAATAAGGMASSPRVSANATHSLGKARGVLDLLGIDPAKLGLFAYQRQERTGR